MGVREDWAEELLNALSGKNHSALPMIRLLRSISDYLQDYEGRYAEKLKHAVANGRTLAIPEENLIERGAAPEEIQYLALYHAEKAVDWVMSLLYCRLDESKLFKNSAFSECGHIGLVELSPNGNPTGKYYIYPTGAEFYRWLKKDE